MVMTCRRIQKRLKMTILEPLNLKKADF